MHFKFGIIFLLIFQITTSLSAFVHRTPARASHAVYAHRYFSKNTEQSDQNNKAESSLTLKDLIGLTAAAGLAYMTTEPLFRLYSEAMASLCAAIAAVSIVSIMGTGQI